MEEAGQIPAGISTSWPAVAPPRLTKWRGTRSGHRDNVRRCILRPAKASLATPLDLAPFVLHLSPACLVGSLETSNPCALFLGGLRDQGRRGRGKDQGVQLGKTLFHILRLRPVHSGRNQQRFTRRHVVARFLQKIPRPRWNPFFIQRTPDRRLRVHFVHVLAAGSRAAGKAQLDNVLRYGLRLELLNPRPGLLVVLGRNKSFHVRGTRQSGGAHPSRAKSARQPVSNDPT